MLRFAANLSLLYPQLPFMQRFAAAAADGFAGVEILFPYDQAAAAIATALREQGLQAVLINTPLGNAAAGDRGLAGQPGREAEFEQALDRAIDVARTIDCPRIHLMSGVGSLSEGLEQRRPVLLRNLRHAARRLAPHGLAGLVEPINGRDIPGYLVRTQAQAHGLVQELGEPNLAVQMDLYHCQIAEGDLATRLAEHLPGGRVAHIQIAGVPERHEPDRGELHYPYLFERIDALGYQGWIGCEYRPRGDTSAGLAWLRRWREREALTAHA